MEGFKQLFKSVKTLNARGRILEDLKVHFFENYFLHKLPLKSVVEFSKRDFDMLLPLLGTHKRNSLF